MEKTPLISVVLPTYHVAEKYVAQCVECIRRQSYTNWEAVIVDDGNPAEYAAWLETFADSKIRVIHQKNGGVASARNRGALEAKGEWIYFCDPDDRMRQNELSALLEAAVTTGAEVAVCQYTRVDMDSDIRPEDGCGLQEYHALAQQDTEQLLLELIAPGRAAAIHHNEWISACANIFPWAHLYKASLAREVLFPPMHQGEDKIFNLHIAERAKGIVFVLSPLHDYRVGTGVTSRLNRRQIETTQVSHSALFAFISGHRWSCDITREIHKALMDEIAVVTKCILNEAETASDFAGRLTEYMSPADYQQTIRDIKNPYYTRNQRLLCRLLRFRLFGMLRLYWRLHR